MERNVHKNTSLGFPVLHPRYVLCPCHPPLTPSMKTAILSQLCLILSPCLSSITKKAAQNSHRDWLILSTYPTELKLTWCTNTVAVVKALNAVWTNPPAAIAMQAWDLVPVESPQCQAAPVTKHRPCPKLSRSFGTVGSWRRNSEHGLWAVCWSLCPEHRKVCRLSPRTEWGSE